jgi:hypothetical protein
MLTNANKLPLEILEQGVKESLPAFALCEEEEASIMARLIVVAPLEYACMSYTIDFNEWFEAECLLEAEDNTFKIWYQSQYSYICFQPIQI